MESRKLGEKAAEKGLYLMKRLGELMETYSIIGDVRGMGLMIGVELVEENKDTATEECKFVIRRALEGGMILLPAGDSVIRFVPPLIITREEIDRGMEIFENAIRGK